MDPLSVEAIFHSTSQYHFLTVNLYRSSAKVLPRNKVRFWGDVRESGNTLTSWHKVQ